MRMTNPFQFLSSLWKYYGCYRKGKRILSDWEKLQAEWIRIGGFNASTGELLNFLSGFSLYLVEYATWTVIELDDQMAKVVRDILIDHRDILISLIDWVRSEHKPSAAELGVLAEMAGMLPEGVLPEEEYSQPMMVLYILINIYQALVFLKTLRKDNVPPLPAPDTTPQPINRPVLHFIRQLFGKK